MKKITVIFPLLLALMVFVAASCGSSRSFSSRKYMAGNYVSHKHKSGKVSVHETPEQEPAVLINDEVLSEKAAAVEKSDAVKDECVVSDKTALGMTSEKRSTPSPVNTEKKASVEKKEVDAKVLKREAFRKYIAGKTERKCLAYDDDDKSLDPIALVSFILGILGLALNILAISVIVATAEYVFALLFIAGLVMGIIAVVFGTQGLRRHHKNNGSTLDLVFSIIGTAFGAGAIITAFVFAFYTLILALSGL